MPSYQYIYTMDGLSKTFPGGKTILQDIRLSFLPEAKIGIVGSNGTGKSTLLKIMAGIDKEFQGEAWPAKNISIGYLPQEPVLDPDKTVLETIHEGVADALEALQRFEDISARFSEELDDQQMQDLIAEQAQAQEIIDEKDLWDLDARVKMASEALRCPPDDVKIATLSGGERRRVALCALLLQQPDLLLLDEPTNHLDAETVAWLESFLGAYRGTVIIITHDRYFLDNVSEWILEIDRGHALPHKGNYSSWLESKQERLAQATGKEEERRSVLARELEWIRSGADRRGKNKARLRAYETLLQQGDKPREMKTQIVLPTPPRLGDVVIEAENIRKSFENKALMDSLSFRLPPGGIVGVVGSNGTGKTTLLRMLAGLEKPDSGTLRIGETVHLGYAEQNRDNLEDNRTVFEEISQDADVLRIGGHDLPSRAYVAMFNFHGADQQKKVCDLSGGERNRVQLAKMLKEERNLLLLDEPSNDLDVDTLRALEDALLVFPGCVMTISHDRWFLDRIATHILAFEGDGHVEWFEGNHAAYETSLEERTSDGVRRSTKYRRFSR